MSSIGRGVAALIAAALTCAASPAAPAQAAAAGNVLSRTAYRNPVIVGNAADPSVIRGQDGHYYLYTSSTQIGTTAGRQHILPIWRSTDLTHWRYVGDAFAQPPAWAADDQIWAPDVHYFNNRYYLYFTVAHAKALPRYGSPTSTADAGVSAIGVATAPTPAGPWTEAGPTAGDGYPTGPIVAPSYGWCLDKANPACYKWHFDSYVYQGPTGVRYLYEGSYFGGNRLYSLTPDGLGLASGPTQFGHNIRYEASYVVPHTVGGTRYYYMLNSQSDCCAGADSPYSVVANRATQLQGQFSDQHGNPMEWAYGPSADPATLNQPWDDPIWWNLAGEGGGYPVLKQNGNNTVGPGGQAVITDLAGRDWMLYHGVDQRNPWQPATTDPLRQLYLDPLDWTAEGWPVANNGDGPGRGTQAPVTRPWLLDTFDRPSALRWTALGGTWQHRSDPAAGGYLHQDATARGAGLLSRAPAVTGQAGYRVECDVRSAGSSGSYGCATSVHDDSARLATIDLTTHTLRLSNLLGRRVTSASSTALPAGFRAADWSHLIISGDDHAVTVTLENSDRNPLADVTLPGAAPAGRIALVTDSAAADFDNVSAATRDTTVASPSGPPPPGRVLTDDRFGGTISAGWNWLREDPALHRFAPTGALSLTSNGNLDGYQRLNADAHQPPELPWTRNVLLQPAPATNWMIQTRLHFDPQDANLIAGITAYSDDDHHVDTGIAWNGNLTQIVSLRNDLHPLGSPAARCPLAAPSPGGNVAITRYGPHACPATSEHTSQEAPARLDCCWNGNGQAGADTDPSHVTVYLRLYRHGDVYTPWYSYDGNTWQRAAAWKLHPVDPAHPLQIGLFASNNQHITTAGAQAWFDYVTVHQQ